MRGDAQLGAQAGRQAGIPAPRVKVHRRIAERRPLRAVATVVPGAGCRDVDCVWYRSVLPSGRGGRGEGEGVTVGTRQACDRLDTRVR